MSTRQPLAEMNEDVDFQNEHEGAVEAIDVTRLALVRSIEQLPKSDDGDADDGFSPEFVYQQFGQS